MSLPLPWGANQDEAAPQHQPPTSTTRNPPGADWKCPVLVPSRSATPVSPQDPVQPRSLPGNPVEVAGGHNEGASMLHKQLLHEIIELHLAAMSSAAGTSSLLSSKPLGLFATHCAPPYSATAMRSLLSRYRSDAVTVTEALTMLPRAQLLDFAQTLHAELTAVCEQIIKSTAAPHRDDPSVDEDTSMHTSDLSEPSLMSFASARSPLITRNLREFRDDIGMKVVNQYTLLKELGRGSFGKVKLAAGAGDELVAIKVIAHAQVRARALSSGVGSGVGSGGGSGGVGSGGGSGGEETLAAVEREVALMAKLRHKNVLRLREVINDPDARHMYLVMNYAERGPLLALRANGTCTALDFDVARGYMKQLLSGLHYLHARRVWHRDIKPSNILLGGDGVVYFADFGVSSYFDAVDDGGGGGGGGGQQQQLRDAAGTPAFHAPEVWSGEAYLGGPADVWALGVTFYAMVYGRLPFRGATSAELRRAVCEGELEFPADLPASINFFPRSPSTPLHGGLLPPTSSSIRAAKSDADAEGMACRAVLELDPGCSSRMGSRTPRRREGIATTPQRGFGPGAAGGAGAGGGGEVHVLSDSCEDNALASPSNGAAVVAEISELHDLLRGMLEKVTEKRLTVSQCKRHPFVRTVHRNRTRIAQLAQEGLSLAASSASASFSPRPPPQLP